MTIDEAIKHQTDMAERYRYQLALSETGDPLYALGYEGISRIKKYIEKYTQVAEWLEELKAIKDSTVFYSNRPIEDIVLEAKADAIDNAIHRLDNSKTTCNEDYIDGIDFAIGVLKNISEQLKNNK